MPFPRKIKETEIIDKNQFPPGYFEQFEGKQFDEVLAVMADQEKELLAAAVIRQIKSTADPSSMKILLAALEKQGFSSEKEIPISDERFKEIIRVAASRI